MAASGREIESVDVTFPERGVERSVEVGGTLRSTGRLLVYENGITVRSLARTTAKRLGATFELLIPAGDYPGASWIDGGMVPLGNTNSYYPVPDGSFRFLKQSKPVRGGIGMFVDPNTKILTARMDTGFGSRTLPIPDADFQVHRCTRRSDAGLQSDVIFTGAAKGVVTLQYREFSNGLARPAFSQDYTFDLANGNELAFRGTRIRVIKVDNAGLRYVVLAAGEGGQ